VHPACLLLIADLAAADALTPFLALGYSYDVIWLLHACSMPASAFLYADIVSSLLWNILHYVLVCWCHMLLQCLALAWLLGVCLLHVMIDPVMLQGPSYAVLAILCCLLICSLDYVHCLWLCRHAWLIRSWCFICLHPDNAADATWLHHASEIAWIYNWKLLMCCELYVLMMRIWLMLIMSDVDICPWWSNEL